MEITVIVDKKVHLPHPRSVATLIASAWSELHWLPLDFSSQQISLRLPYCLILADAEGKEKRRGGSEIDADEAAPHADRM